MVYTLQEIKRLVAPIIQKYNIPAMYLFGSYARGSATQYSDLDFLVDTTGTGLTSLLKLGQLYCDLEDAFQKRVDLITVGSLSQNQASESDRNFADTVYKERIRLDDVA